MSDHRFEAIMEAYEKQMYFVALSILRNHHDAEDAVQTALMCISRQAKHLPQNTQALRAYVLTAAKHAALNLLPKQCKDADLDNVVAVSTEDLFETVVASQEYDRLLVAIKSLPPTYREVLMLRYVQQLDTKQMAKLLDRPRGTVQKQISRAKALLVQIYHKESELYESL
ncbi:MAG: RNA polymerase sigma factor [Oscillospiraceae bacterium]|nr:RNA polymerase sigma factor [Oscillospiraceae bacterium]